MDYDMTREFVILKLQKLLVDFISLVLEPLD